MAAPALALLLASCTTFERITTPVSLPDNPPKQAEAPTAREHNRILAAYGGAYQDARLEGLITQTVDKLVAASERPNLKYKVTILNSAAINAFALPNGQLYVTRGLLALANDTSELASVLSHEMAHVIARHAAIREDQAKQASLKNRVHTDLLEDPQTGAMALARSKIAARDLFAPAGAGGRRRRRRHFAARGLRSLRCGAFPHRDGPQRRTARAGQQWRRTRASSIFCHRTRAPPTA